MTGEQDGHNLDQQRALRPKVSGYDRVSGDDDAEYFLGTSSAAIPEHRHSATCPGLVWHGYDASE